MGKAINKYTFYDSGFHGDEYLTKIVKALMTDCDLFIETGTNVATTTAYVSKRFPQVLCFSCEPDDRAYKEAVKNTKNLPNVNIFNETSQNFINRFEKMNLFRKNAVFWLDAHDNNFEWPLKSEVGFITSKFQNFKILIDDFKVPGLPCFGFDSYKNQECSFNFIRNSIKSKSYFLYYPNYTEKTSKHHPLRGWGLISSQSIDYILENNLITYISKGN